MKTFPSTSPSSTDIAAGNVPGQFAVNKFGQSLNVDSGIDTDIYDLGTQPIWLAPTAARVHAIVSTDATDACGLGTLTLTENAGDGDTVTIGTKSYVFEVTLTDTDGNVKIGAAATDSIDNLIAAINLAAGAGSTYATSTTAIDGKAFVGAGDTMTYYDHTSGTIASTDTLSGASAWGATTIPVGVGARSIRVYGLKTWATDETSEDFYMYGDDTQNTANSYVIIHRMEVLTSGATKVNAGIITATAASDATVTAEIIIGEGQTQMAIYGIPSTQKAYMSSYNISGIKAAAAVRVEMKLLVNTEPDANTLNYKVKDTVGIDTTGNSYVAKKYDPPKMIEGPAIIKLQGNASADNTIVTAGFDMILINN